MDLDMKKVVCTTIRSYPLSQHCRVGRFILSQGGGPWFIISLKPLVYSNKQNAFSSLAQWFSLDALGPIWFYLYTVTELQFL